VFWVFFGCIGSRLGCLGNGVIVLMCWVDICWVVVCFWDFVLGVLRTWYMGFGVFWGVIGLMLTANAGPGRL